MTGWTRLGSTDDGGSVFIAPAGTPPPAVPDLPNTPITGPCERCHHPAAGHDLDGCSGGRIERCQCDGLMWGGVVWEFQWRNYR